MSRFSPQTMERPGNEALNDWMTRGLDAYLQGKRQLRADERQKSADERQSVMDRIAIESANGPLTFERPVAHPVARTPIAEAAPAPAMAAPAPLPTRSIFEGQSVSEFKPGQPVPLGGRQLLGRDLGAPPVRAPFTGQPSPALDYSAALAGAVGGGQPRMAYRPGEFVREAGTFTNRPVFTAPAAMPRTMEQLGAPGTARLAAMPELPSVLRAPPAGVEAPSADEATPVATLNGQALYRRQSFRTAEQKAADLRAEAEAAGRAAGWSEGEAKLAGLYGGSAVDALIRAHEAPRPVAPRAPHYLETSGGIYAAGESGPPVLQRDAAGKPLMPFVRPTADGGDSLARQELMTRRAMAQTAYQAVNAAMQAARRNFGDPEDVRAAADEAAGPYGSAAGLYAEMKALGMSVGAKMGGGTSVPTENAPRGGRSLFDRRVSFDTLAGGSGAAQGTAAADSVAAQQAMWDRAATALRAQRKNPTSVLGARP